MAAERTPRLLPTDVPRRVPGAQITALPDARLLVRAPAGSSVLGGVALEDLERVLALADGTRTAGAICGELADEYEADDVLTLLGQLVGDVLQVVPEGSDGGFQDGAEILVVGGGRLARRVARGLAAERLGSGSPPEVLRLASRRLVVGALEEASYEDLFELQAACLKAGTTSLWVTADPDATRIGPTVVPGATPCFACAQIAGLRFLRLGAVDLTAAARRWRTGNARRGAAEAAAREARAVRDGRPALLTSVAKLTADGERARYRVPRAVDCPLCSGVPRPDGAVARMAELELCELDGRSPPRASVDDDAGLCTSVGILGGGTAGYLAALALRRKLPALDVTLIESSAVPVIGVGEATTPLMPQFLHVDLGLDVHELFREVQPTFKLGIRFDWGPPECGGFNYPFGPLRVLEPMTWDGDLRRGSLQSILMSAGALPVTGDGGPRRSWLGPEAAYHLDNARLVRYLRRCARRAGVVTVDAKIGDVEVSGDGQTVRGLVAEDGRRFRFDLYIDCSGFRSLLLGGALRSPFLSYAGSLFTDRAIVAAVPHGGAIRPYTRAETLPAGWCWSTPQRDADHRGYVFSSAFASPEEAEAEMRQTNPGMGDARLVRFTAGRREHFWRGNVVALGNAYGFVEPLESTALHMLVRQIGMLVEAFPLCRGERGAAAILSRRAGAWWDYLCWFLAIHYRYNRRLDSPFWRCCRRQVDVSRHGELIEAFRERGPLSCDRALRRGFDAPDPLWGPVGIDVLLLGQRLPARLPRPAMDRAQWAAHARRLEAVAGRALAQEQALALFDEEPEHLESWARAFARVGPAFA